MGSADLRCVQVCGFEGNESASIEGKSRRPPEKQGSAIPYTGAISDILDEMGLTKQVLPKEIQSIHPGQTLAGRSLTLLGGLTVSTDPDVIFRPFRRMLGEVRPGDLLVSQPMTVGQPISANSPVRLPSIGEPGVRSLMVVCAMSTTSSSLGSRVCPI